MVNTETRQLSYNEVSFNLNSKIQHERPKSQSPNPPSSKAYHPLETEEGPDTSACVSVLADFPTAQWQLPSSTPGSLENDLLTVQGSVSSQPSRGSLGYWQTPRARHPPSPLKTCPAQLRQTSGLNPDLQGASPSQVPLLSAPPGIRTPPLKNVLNMSMGVPNPPRPPMGPSFMARSPPRSYSALLWLSDSTS